MRKGDSNEYLSHLLLNRHVFPGIGVGVVEDRKHALEDAEDERDQNSIKVQNPQLGGE